MTLQQLCYFKEIAQTQNFTLAAQKLYVAQSGLSHAIQNLERELGAPLLLRSAGKKVALTSYGQALLPYAARILAEVGQAEREIEQMRNPMSGVVTLAYSYVNGFELVPRIFNRFYLENQYQEISVRFEVNHTAAEIEQNLLLGKTDLAITCTEAANGLVTRPIAKQELVVMLPTLHPLAGRKSLKLCEIKDEPLLCYNPGSNLFQWITRIFQAERLRPNIAMILPDWSSQMAYLSLGLGIAISPRLPVDVETISMVPFDHPLNTRDIYLLWAGERTLPPAAEYVKQYCMNCQPDMAQ